MDWKERRRKILDSIDSNLQKRVDTAQQRYGETGGKVASGIAAATSAVADFVTPEDGVDAATMAVGGGALKALRKLRKIKKAESAVKPTKEIKASKESLEKYRKEHPIGYGELVKNRLRKDPEFKRRHALGKDEIDNLMMPVNKTRKSKSKTKIKGQ